MILYCKERWYPYNFSPKIFNQNLTRLLLQRYSNTPIGMVEKNNLREKCKETFQKLCVGRYLEA